MRGPCESSGAIVFDTFSQLLGLIVISSTPNAKASVHVQRPAATFRGTFAAANTAFRAGRFREALKGYAQVQEFAPTESAAYYNAAKCCVELGDRAKATRMYYMFQAYANTEDPERNSELRWFAEDEFSSPGK